MKSTGNGVGPSLSDQSRKFAWRIFGALGKSRGMLSGHSFDQLIYGLVRKHVPDVNQPTVVSEIQGWFKTHGTFCSLRPEVVDQVASAIVEELKDEDWKGKDWSETEVWAISFIDPEHTVSLIRSHWSAFAIESFVHAALKTLKAACDQNKILSNDHETISEIPNIDRDGIVKTFQDILNFNRSFMFDLHPVVFNLIILLRSLHPNHVQLLAESLDHPVVQASAAWFAIQETRSSNHKETLKWIREDSCSAQIALAILLSLETVNCLDYDVRWDSRHFTVHNDATHQWSTELRPPCDNLDLAAESLLTGLVDSLLQFNPPECVQWIGELLSTAPNSLELQGNGKPARVQQLETACIEALVSLARQSWSSNLTESLSRGLRTAHREMWTRHLSAFAWALYESAPKHATQIAQVALCSHEAHVAQVLEHNIPPMLDRDDWECQERNSRLGACLAVADQTLDLQEWVVNHCRQLPLSAWDADNQENYQAFKTAEQVARHWFLIAFHALPHLKQLGRKVDPAAVLSLTETFFDHCHYTQPYVFNHPASSDEAEIVVRYAVEFGDAGMQRLLGLARHPAVTARVLWSVLYQGKLKLERAGDGEARSQVGEMFLTELSSIASEHFGDGRGCGLDDLAYWGRLWLSLGMVDEAEKTARAILAFPFTVNQEDNILTLKLLALVAGKGRLELPLQDRLQALYHELWSVSTPKEERSDREQVDSLLKGLPQGLLSKSSTR